MHDAQALTMLGRQDRRIGQPLSLSTSRRFLLAWVFPNMRVCLYTPGYPNLLDKDSSKKGPQLSWKHLETVHVTYAVLSPPHDRGGNRTKEASAAISRDPGVGLACPPQYHHPLETFPDNGVGHNKKTSEPQGSVNLPAMPARSSVLGQVASRGLGVPTCSSLLKRPSCWQMPKPYALTVNPWIQGFTLNAQTTRP